MNWEYKILESDELRVSQHRTILPNEAAFNALGADRWELVAVDGNHAYFKREAR